MKMPRIANDRVVRGYIVQVGLTYIVNNILSVECIEYP